MNDDLTRRNNVLRHVSRSLMGPFGGGSAPTVLKSERKHVVVRQDTCIPRNNAPVVRRLIEVGLK